MGKSAIDARISAKAHRRHKATQLLLCTALSLPAALSNAATWKWHDADGNVTYGDAPPRSAGAEAVRIHPGPGSRSQPDTSSTPRNAGSKPTAVAAATPSKQDKTLCTQARTNLDILNSSALVRQTDENGEERILDENQKQAQIQTAQEIIRHHC